MVSDLSRCLNNLTTCRLSELTLDKEPQALEGLPCQSCTHLRRRKVFHGRCETQQLKVSNMSITLLAKVTKRTSCLDDSTSPKATAFHISPTTRVGHGARIVEATRQLTFVNITRLGRVGPGLVTLFRMIPETSKVTKLGLWAAV